MMGVRGNEMHVDMRKRQKSGESVATATYVTYWVAPTGPEVYRIPPPALVLTPTHGHCPRWC